MIVQGSGYGGVLDRRDLCLNRIISGLFSLA